jgi:type VI secretion system protein VasJ
MASRIDSWLAPISAAAPAGEDARYQPAHEQVREQVARLESPEGRAVEWARVLGDGSEVLRTQAKDLWMGCCVAIALYELEGLAGLSEGTALVHGLLEGYWDKMFPPPQRIRARAGALQWFVDRAATKLAAEAAGSGAEVDALITRQTALRALVRERFADEAPAFQALDDALARVGAARGAQAPAVAVAVEVAVIPATVTATEPATATVTATATVAATEPATEPATVTATATVTAPAPGAEPVSAQPPQPAAPSQVEVAVAVAVAAAPAASPFEQRLAALTAPWCAPIREAAPCGKDCRYDDPVHEALRSQIARFESPAAVVPNWGRLIEQASELLQQRSKDLLIASYLAEGLRRRDGWKGAVQGTALLYALLERYWDGLFPGNERNDRARASAVAFWVDKLATLGTVPLTASDRPELEFFDELVERMAALLMERFDDKHRPAVTPLREQVSRLKLNLPAAAAPATTTSAAHPAAAAGTRPQPAAAGTATAAAPAGATSAASDAGSAGVAVPLPENVKNPMQVGKFLQGVRGALFELARGLRATAPKTAQPYRLVRIAAYLRFSQPPAHEAGTTKVQFSQPAESFEALLAEKKHAELIEAAEDALEASPLWLDLHRYSWLGLCGLGEGHEAAAEAVAQASGGWVAALPGLLELRAADGRPFASAATRAWFAEHAGVSGRSAPNGDLNTGALAGQKSEEAALELLAAGKLEAGLAAFQEAVRRAPNARQRFLSTLAMAEALAKRSPQLAVGLFGGLADEIEARDLAHWDPELAARCLAGYHQCLAPLAKKNQDLERTASLIYRRLCSVDPGRALKVTTSG